MIKKLRTFLAFALVVVGTLVMVPLQLLSMKTGLWPETVVLRIWHGMLWRDYSELRNRVCDLVGAGLSSAEWKRYASGNPYHQSCG